MTIELDETHDPALGSWVAGSMAGQTDFPIQNLPFGVALHDGRRRVVVAIGASMLDLQAACDAGLFSGQAAQAAGACDTGSLNGLMALSPAHWSALRLQLSRLLRNGSPQQAAAAQCLLPIDGASLQTPARIGNFTDFYTSVHHAVNAGRMMRPDAPLLPNFRHLPVAYHGRASSVSPSGTPLVRPKGQFRAKDAALPQYGPCTRLDFELEVGFYVGVGNALGEPVPLADADSRVFGLCLVNDWSARDIQAWEYQPLGPFLAKSFLTSVSPWVVTLDALAPFRVPAAPRGDGAPALLPHLDTTANTRSGGVDIALDVLLQTQAMRDAGQPAERITQARFADQYWTIFQMLAHHTSNGCNLEPGDLLASGTVSSGEAPHQAGCLLEMTLGGARPLRLADGSERAFLEDGDEITLRGRCTRPGQVPIGFGECRGRVVPARASGT